MGVITILEQRIAGVLHKPKCRCAVLAVMTVIPALEGWCLSIEV